MNIQTSVKYLLRPVNPYKQKEAVIGLYNRSRDLSLRHFFTPTDLPAVADWLEQDYVLQLPEGLGSRRRGFLLQTNLSNLSSRDAQVFMCLADETPIAQVDVFQATRDAYCSPYCEETDYSLYFIQSPKMRKSAELFQDTMKMITDYLSMFKEVKRILTLSVSESPPGGWLVDAGFRKIRDIKLQEGFSEMYVFSCH